MTDNSSGASREALRRAADYIAASLRRGSPSAEISAAWTVGQVRGAGDDASVHIRNRRISAWATATDARHPAWGHWFGGPKVATNWANPGRTNWDARALEQAANFAAERFGDTWIRDMAESSDFWSVGRG